jgi:hypothetical protein
MFCYIFKLFDQTNISAFNFCSDCDHECEYYDPQLMDCDLGKRVSINLSSDKFGWILQNSIPLGENFVSSNGHTNYIHAISIIHPMCEDVWIIKCNRLNKQDQWYTVYMLYHEHKLTEFKELDSINKWLVNFKYEIRKITDADFKKEEIIDVSN